MKKLLITGYADFTVNYQNAFKKIDNSFHFVMTPKPIEKMSLREKCMPRSELPLSLLEARAL